MKVLTPFLIILTLYLTACGTDEEPIIEAPKSVLADYFGDDIDYSDLANYAKQEIPSYITKDNTRGNDITDEGATLGRVLFYDKNLSVDNSTSCATCHKQEYTFSDNQQASKGVNGFTGRHSMRLVNARFSNETRFFWDERATTLEEQTTMPMQDHVEMGYSGQDGDPNFADLINKLEGLKYYNELFYKTFGDSAITETLIQKALAQFVRSIQAFDSKFDEGRAMANNDGQPFANFTDIENDGKGLFLAPPQFDVNGLRIAGGLGCGGCHRAPEFDIASDSRNNGVIGSISGDADLGVTRSPSLRNVVKADGTANGPFMHIGVSENLATVIEHYNKINDAGNNNLDRRLTPGGNPQDLNMTEDEKTAVIAFLRTLDAPSIYTDKKWSDPFLQ
jgi:cytochrome c peroxidase